MYEEKVLKTKWVSDYDFYKAAKKNPVGSQIVLKIIIILSFNINPLHL